MPKTQISYSILDEKTNDEEHTEAMRAYHTIKSAKRKSDIIAIILALIVLSQAIWIWIYDQRPCNYRTDFTSIRSTIGNEEKGFSGWIWDDEYRYVKRPIDLSKPQYFGDPETVPEMEENWDKLLEVQFFALSEQEAQSYPDILPHPGTEYKYMELDVTHKLHCVNQLRKLLYNRFYNYTIHPLQDVRSPPGFYLEHMDHCLENLFDGIICHGDLTPAPIWSYKSFIPGLPNVTYSISETHTCRNFEQVRQWLYERARQRPSFTSRGQIYAPGQ